MGSIVLTVSLRSDLVSITNITHFLKFLNISSHHLWRLIGVHPTPVKKKNPFIASKAVSAVSEQANQWWANASPLRDILSHHPHCTRLLPHSSLSIVECWINWADGCLCDHTMWSLLPKFAVLSLKPFPVNLPWLWNPDRLRDSWKMG